MADKKQRCLIHSADTAVFEALAIRPYTTILRGYALRIALIIFSLGSNIILK